MQEVFSKNKKFFLRRKWKTRLRHLRRISVFTVFQKTAWARDTNRGTVATDRIVLRQTVTTLSS